METEVLIVGAGGGGLTLALWLTRLGVRVRIIDRAPGPGGAARAFALQARTLELYDQLGLARDVVARGRPVAEMNVHRGRGPAETIAFGDFGRGLSPYPFVLVLLQDDLEKLLIEHLGAAGVVVEHGSELIDLETHTDRITARLRGPSGDELSCDAAYVCGCDGVASMVRELAWIQFPGASSEELFYVADVVAEGPVVNGELHYVMAGEDLCSVFPLRGKGRVRLIGLAPEAVKNSQVQITFDDIADHIGRDVDLEVSMVESFATYRVHQRIAPVWRRGRAFLVGDASHVHSPAGGQGMNAAIGDAVNLAWKLAEVLKGGADQALLDTYQSERILAARRIEATTDWGFALQAQRGPLMGLIRSAATGLAPAAMAFTPFRRWVFRTISQLAIDYRASGTCAGRAGAVSGGDRLPWVQLAGGADNFTALRGAAWQAHVYGRPNEALVKACADLSLPLHAFTWAPAMAQAGVARDAVYLVRPDGYVALADARQDSGAIRAQLDRFGLKLGQPGSR